MRILTLEKIWWNETHPEIDFSPEKTYLHIERQDFIARIIESLSDNEKWLILLKYGFLQDSEKIEKEVEFLFKENFKKASLKRIEFSALRKIASIIKEEKYIEEESILDKKKKRTRKQKNEETAKEGYEDEKHIIELQNIIELASKLEPYLITHLKRKPLELEKLPWNIFEELVAEFFASWGFEVEMFGNNPRSAADLLAIKKEDNTGTRIRYLIEIKKWRDKIGVEVIDRVLGALTGEREKFGWHLAMIVTLAGVKKIKKYTTSELSLKGVELKEKEHVITWLNDYKFNDKGLWLPRDFKVLHM